jgi:Rha family phage regulatory protein
MNLLPIELVTLAGDQLVTDSLRVARHFNKHHRDVLRALDRLDCSADFRLRNFAQTVTHRANPSGGKPIAGRVVQMTKDGFMFLAMGFTGHEAAIVKEAYIGAFNTMAEQLERRDLGMLSKLLDYEARQRDSLHRAKFGSGLMNQRRRELPGLKREEGELKAIAQTSLFKLVKSGA